MTIECISAVTIAVRDMERSVSFYKRLGFTPVGRTERFTSFKVGGAFLNLIAIADFAGGWWGRLIFWVDDVDAQHAEAKRAGLTPEAEPRDAPWGERFYHIIDPDGHELSFARPLGHPSCPPTRPRAHR